MPELQKLFDEIEQKQSELEKLRPISEDRMQKIREKLVLDYNYHTNHIEGNTLTRGETKSLILYGMQASFHGGTINLQDANEMLGHIEAFNLLNFLQDKILTEDLKPPELTEYEIKNLHRIIMGGKDITSRKEINGTVEVTNIPAGNYKTQSNSVKTNTGEIFQYAGPSLVPALMHDLLDWYNQHRVDLEPLVLAAIFHYKFIRIHPFGDGNGRMSRLLMNLVLQSSGYPLVIIKSEDAFRNEYLQSLQLTDQNLVDLQIGEIVKLEQSDVFESFIEFIGQRLLESQDLMIRGARGEELLDSNDTLKKLDLELKIKPIGAPKGALSNPKIGAIFIQNLAIILEKIQRFCEVLLENHVFSHIILYWFYKSYIDEYRKIYEFLGGNSDEIKKTLVNELPPLEKLDVLKYQYDLMLSATGSVYIVICIYLNDENWQLKIGDFEFTQEYNFELEDEKINKLLNYIIAEVKKD